MVKQLNEHSRHFSKLLEIVDNNQSRFEYRKKENWKTNTKVVNSITDILVQETCEKLVSWWDDNAYESTQSSKFLNGRTAINRNIVKYYNGTLKEMLPWEILSASKHIDKLHKKILANTPHFLDEVTCREIYNYFIEVDDIGDMDIWELEFLLDKGEFERFFAIVLFFIAAEMPKSTDVRFSYRKIFGKEKTFIDEIIGELNQGKYYDYYNRTVIIEPKIEDEQYSCETILEFSAPLLNRLEPEANYLDFTFSFQTEEQKQAHQFTALVINNIDYTESCKPIDESVDFDSKYCFKIKYRVENVKASSSYRVLRKTKSLLLFPVGEGSYALPYLSKKHKLEVRFNPKSKKVNELFDINGVYFAPFSSQDKKRLVTSSSKHYKVESFSPAPKGSGIKFIIMPNERKNDVIELNSLKSIKINTQEVVFENDLSDAE